MMNTLNASLNHLNNWVECICAMNNWECYLERNVIFDDLK